MKPNTDFFPSTPSSSPTPKTPVQNMYNIDQTIDSPKASGPIPAGINENCTLIGVFFEPLRQDGTGGNVLKFNFADAAGRKFRHTEFEVEADRVKQQAAQWGKDPEKQLRNALTGLAGRIKHILSCFLPADKVVITGNTWDEFGGNVVSLLGDAFKGVPVRLKLILNNKDYTCFPKQAFRPFVQRMDVPNTLEVDAKWERIVPKSAAGTSESDLDAILGAVNVTPAASPSLDDAIAAANTATPTTEPAPWDEGPAPSLGTPTGNDEDLVF